MSTQNSLPHATLTINTQQVHTGVLGIAPKTYAVIVDGRAVDTAYGTHSQALDQLDDWKRADGVDLDTPFDELLEDNTYWKNGHIPQLTLEPEKMTLAEAAELAAQWEAANPEEGNGLAWGVDY